MRILLLISFLAIFTGCSTVMNPYSSDFKCPRASTGKCVSVQDAYTESITGRDGKKEKDENGGSLMQDELSKGEGKPEYTAYEAARLKRLEGVLKEPKTPMIAPPKVVRVMLLPYKGSENELYMYRYTYFMVDDPQWVLGDQIRAIEEE